MDEYTIEYLVQGICKAMDSMFNCTTKAYLSPDRSDGVSREQVWIDTVDNRTRADGEFNSIAFEMSYEDIIMSAEEETLYKIFHDHYRKFVMDNAAART